jgi:hypothetical protein
LRWPWSALPLRDERRAIGDHEGDGEDNGEAAAETHGDLNQRSRV